MGVLAPRVLYLTETGRSRNYASVVMRYFGAVLQAQVHDLLQLSLRVRCSQAQSPYILPHQLDVGQDDL